jgi:hypothetical protein
MSEKHGLIKTTIRLIKKDEELMDRIILDRDIVEAKVETLLDILRHNVWTIQQFADITGLAQSTIANKCRPQYKNGEIGTELDHCYPFADLEGLGPKFIVRNEKSEALLP